MYKNDKQMSLAEFIFPYGELNTENEWIKLSTIIPWEKIEEKYAANFVNNGHPAHPARMALGALLIKQRLSCSDEWVVRHISENPYMQYFIGLNEYSSNCPFGESTLVAFRKRFDCDTLMEINEMIIEEKEVLKNDDNSDNDNGGTLILDATCVPSDVRYPQDLSLLNESREKTEKMMDCLHKQIGGDKPRNYRQEARKEYLKVSKMRKKTGKVIRKAIRKQLNYLNRNIKIVEGFIEKGALLSQKEQSFLDIINIVYKQQYTMHTEHSQKTPDRIVSLSQSWVRPIVRNKARAKTEFGAKLHLSLSNGFARVEYLSFNAYIESEDFVSSIERYFTRTGRYPARVLADKLYRNQANLAYCKEHNISMTGPRLGRPPKDYAPDKKQEYLDICERNTIEGAFGTAKTVYGLSRIYTRLEETSKAVIYVAVLWLNLSKRLKSLLHPFFIRLFQYFFSALFHPLLLCD